MTRILFAHGFYSVFVTHTDLTDHTDIVRGGALTGGLNTNNANDTNIFFARGGAERNVDF